MNNRPVLQFDLNGNFVAKWDRVIDAVHSVGVTPNTIIHCCHNRPKYLQAKGYVWLYQEDADMGSIGACCRGKIHTSAGYKWKYINH